MAEQREAVHAHAEGEAAVPLGIETDAAQYIRMHHPRAEDLKPPTAFADPASLAAADDTADVHVGGRLRERKIRRAEASLHRGSEERLGKAIQGTFELGQGDALVDQ